MSSMFDISLSPRRLRWVVSVAFLILLTCGPFGILIIPSQMKDQLKILSDSKNSSENKIAAETFLALLRRGIASDLVVIMTECFMIPSLYFLLLPCGKWISCVATLTRFTMVAIMIVEIFGYFGMGFLTAQDPEEFSDPTLLKSLSALLFLHDMGCKFWEIPFGLHILLVGYMLAFRCLFTPRAFGFLLLLAGCGYILDAIGGLFFTDFSASLLSPTADMLQGIGSGLACLEATFFLYLLVRGVDIEMWHQQMAKCKESASLLGDQD
eukprot:TRINITY_DN43431_c0_g1_i1.p1 TRINITY_DN43431_c0_g1~~TRINITY_DN43431_c0_g1_i1.p1  ORF type:complete len:267 (+),score=25.24 TRINITY_DN43431_c0_g1_i1:216-1016(+)